MEITQWRKVKQKDGGDVSDPLQYNFRFGLFAMSDLSWESLMYLFIYLFKNLQWFIQINQLSLTSSHVC